MSNELLGYRDKVVAVTGAATGMGRETAAILVDLGAQVHAMDIAPVDLPVAQALRVDLSDPESIDAAIAQLPASIDRIFGCAGISAMYLGRSFSPVHVNLVNFVGPRHLIDRLIPRMPAGGAIALIASMTASAWRDNLAKVDEILATPDFASAKKWLEEHVDDPRVLGGDPRHNSNYRFSKEALVVYMKRQTWPLGERQIRINTLSPGLTVTPMMSSFDAITQTGDPDLKMIWPAVGRPSNPREQAEALIFLNSDMARYVSGVDLLSDYGYRVREQLGMPTSLDLIKQEQRA